MHTECDFDTHYCDMDTHECSLYTHEYDFDSYEYDNRMSVVLTHKSVI
jgi:hypothetical protein